MTDMQTGNYELAATLSQTSQTFHESLIPCPTFTWLQLSNGLEMAKDIEVSGTQRLMESNRSIELLDVAPHQFHRHLLVRKDWSARNSRHRAFKAEPGNQKTLVRVEFGKDVMLYQCSDILPQVSKTQNL